MNSPSSLCPGMFETPNKVILDHFESTMHEVPWLKALHISQNPAHAGSDYRIMQLNIPSTSCELSYFYYLDSRL
jgi:hypothetical protein